MGGWRGSWRPSALKEVEVDNPAPAGFNSISLAGIGLSCSLIEPLSLKNSKDWSLIVSELEEWGEVPNSNSLEVESLSENEFGPIATIRDNSVWTIEFLPWGSDGLLRRRCSSPIDFLHAPCGGYTWNDSDLIIVRKELQSPSASSELISSLRSGNLSEAKENLRNCGNVLGLYHKSVHNSRTTPPDPKRWNKRLAEIEESLRADSIWRGQHSRDTECMLSLGDLRLDYFLGNKIRLNRPRLADALVEKSCEFPAIRDLSSLFHDLSRLHFQEKSTLDIVELRLSLIEGWKNNAPEKWCSERVFYSHRGGIAIWEYEQCLLDVIEAVSNQSGAPEPAVSLIRFVRPYQKRMFNNRTIGALSFMSAFFGISNLLNNLPLDPGDIPIPVVLLTFSYVLLGFYRRMAPPPEIPFTHYV